MKKKICGAVIGSLFFAVALCGCGGKDSETTTAAANATEAVTEAGATEAQASTNALKDAAKVTLNGVTFGVGDKASDVVAKLGDQIKPSDKSQPCIPGAGEITHYYYPGLVIAASQYDVISTISFTNDYGEGKDAKTVGGVGLGSTAADIKAALGTPSSEDEYGLSFADGDFSVTVVFADDNTAMSINIDDMSIEL